MTDRRKAPEFGVVEQLGPKRTQHVPEIRGKKLNEHVELQGVRLVWQRAAKCPCTGLNDQTQQPDPNCALCAGLGVFYFGPTDYEMPTHLGALDEVQAAIVEASGGAVIHGVIQRASQMQDFFDRFGNWSRGTMMVSTRPENKISFYDRLIALDSVICWDQVIDAGVGGAIDLKYRARSINLMRSLTTTWRQGVDFYLTAGIVEWLPAATPPTEGTRVVVHYETHPAWRIMDHPHVIRASQQRRKVLQVEGQPLVLQASIRLEFLPLDGPSGVGA